MTHQLLVLLLLLGQLCMRIIHTSRYGTLRCGNGLRIRPGNAASSPLSTLCLVFPAQACFKIALSSRTADNRFLDFAHERLWLLKAFCWLNHLLQAHIYLHLLSISNETRGSAKQMVEERLGCFTDDSSYGKIAVT